ncbi:MAG: hypothetical protein IJ388_03650 [Oscillospiraceae bacterium]|nr:hypothetical protein [Oscillospiraceae bacterium]
MTNNYQFADVCVEITHIHPYFAKLAKDYLGGDTPEISIVITQADIDAERQAEDVLAAADGYLESLVIYRKLCERFVEKGIVLIHSAAIAVDGKAYLFTAPSGTGKTTHIRLWKKKFGDRAIIVNGDKPLISVTPDQIRVWGTPWDGKEHWSTNISVPVAGICQIGRGEENEINPANAGDALSVLFTQTYRPTTEEGMRKTLQLLLEISQRVPFWKLKCNMSIEAAEVSYAAMKGE